MTCETCVHRVVKSHKYKLGPASTWDECGNDNTPVTLALPAGFGCSMWEAHPGQLDMFGGDAA